MRKVIQISCFMAMFMVVTFAAQAQKVGYVDTDAILADMPQVKQAEENLKVLNKQLTARGEQMVKAFQTKYQALGERQQKGEISPLELETESKKLEASQQEIVDYEKDMMSKLEKKRIDELKPIYDRVSDAIKNVAKENGYTFIFEKRTLLYFDESSDIEPKVRAKLGM